MKPGMRKTRWLLSVAATCGLALTSACSEDPLAELGEPRSCEVGDQNEWVYAAMQEVYLFNGELPEVDPRAYASPSEMVRDVRVAPDRWSRVSDKARTEALFQEGKSIGFGFRPKRNGLNQYVVASVHADSSAGRAGLRRGDTFRVIDGFTIPELDADEDNWDGIWGENAPGVTVPVTVTTAEGDRDIVLTKDWIDIITVPTHDVFTVGDRTIGYLFFQTFVDPAFDELDAVFDDFVAQGVTDVIVDVRYNGGGLISVSRHLTNLLVGAVADGGVNYGIRYNDNLAEIYNRTREVSKLDNSLPDIESVAFLTTRSSLSASELLINSVRAHVRTEIVGSTTGGKPVGSKHLSFCDSVLAPITFQLVNARGNGDYYNGLDPQCLADDDMTRELGDPDEQSLFAAISMIAGDGCPTLPDLDAAPPARAADPSEMELGIPELIGWH